MRSETEAGTNIVNMGLKLLEEGLVARTWGNISARISDEEFLITPSGRSYTETVPEDMAIYNLTTGQWRGPYKPSSEKGIHEAAYRVFRDDNFVIHTHQVYGTALGAAGFDRVNITENEREELGGIALAEYGAPGTEELKNAVQRAMETGAHTILMKYHGVVVSGTDMDQAYRRVELLENICRRSYLGRGGSEPLDSAGYMQELPAGLQGAGSTMGGVTTIAAREYASLGRSLKAGLDDMAQMIGYRIPVVNNDADVISKKLKFYNAVLVRGYGAVVKGIDADDTEALKILVNKACVAALQAIGCGERLGLGRWDVHKQHLNYIKNYSVQKYAPKA